MDSSREVMLEGFSLGRYLLLVDYTGRLFRDGKCRRYFCCQAIECKVALPILESDELQIRSIHPPARLLVPRFLGSSGGVKPGAGSSWSASSSTVITCSRVMPAVLAASSLIERTAPMPCSQWY